jgi:2-oxoglutarate ferredoxin oxidoreductase subunit gamma
MTMEEQRIIISGFGGQGVLLIGKLLAGAGMDEGREVSWLPSYGPEMRGGTANCNVILSEELIGAPIVTEATCLIAMNLPSLDKFEHALVPGGLLIYNRSMVPRDPERKDIVAIGIPANEIAIAQGSLKVANVVMLGAYLASTHAVRRDTLEKVLHHALGEGKQHLFEINQRALDAGMIHARPVVAHAAE